MSTFSLSGAKLAVRALLHRYSIEISSNDAKSIDAAMSELPKGTDVYVTSLPSQPRDRQIDICSKLAQAGLRPVPHIVARNIPSPAELEETISRLSAQANVKKALVLAGDRDPPVGSFNSSMDLLETGVFGKYEIRDIAIGAYPEGHPRISRQILETSRLRKMRWALEHGSKLTLVSQFCFDAQPILKLIKDVRAEGQIPIRIGLAGPASKAALIKFAMLCGVGASLKVLRANPLARNLLRGESPEDLIVQLSESIGIGQTTQIDGVHFFTFGSLCETIHFINEFRGAA